MESDPPKIMSHQNLLCKRNRVSLSELATLRQLYAENRKTIEQIGQEYNTATLEYERSRARHDELGSKSTLSTLDESRLTQIVLEKQVEMLERESENLRELMHPIRRLPEEIFRLIFEEITDEEPFKRFAIATKLSHVCQFWRAVALSTSALWTQIEVSMNDDPERVKEFMEATKIRLGNQVPEIVIKGIGPSSVDGRIESFMPALNLDSLKQIGSIRYLFDSSKDLSQMSNPVLTAINSPIEDIMIDVVKPPEGVFKWDFAPTLRRFPTVKHWHLFMHNTVLLQEDDSFPHITVLQLFGTHMPSLGYQLRRFNGLEELQVEGFTFGTIYPFHSILPNLRRIIIKDMIDFPWAYISSLHLQKVETDDATLDFVGFISRHPSIVELVCTGTIKLEDMKRWFDAGINFEYLYVCGDLELFLYLAQKPTPFPKLAYFGLHIRDKQRLSLADFEKVVSARCFLDEERPPEGQGNLRELEFTGDSGDGNEQPDWKESEWVKKCRYEFTEVTEGSSYSHSLEWS